MYSRIIIIMAMILVSQVKAEYDLGPLNRLQEYYNRKNEADRVQSLQENERLRQYNDQKPYNSPVTCTYSVNAYGQLQATCE